MFLSPGSRPGQRRWRDGDIIAEAWPRGNFVRFQLPGNLPFSSLRLVGSGRGTAAAGSVVLQLTFNSDTSTNYDNQRAYGTGTGGTASNANGAGGTYIYLADMAAASATAGVSSAFEVDILDHANNALQKSTMGRYNLKQNTTTTGQFMFIVGGFWRSSAPITRLDIAPSSGNFDAGSHLRLKGIL